MNPRYSFLSILAGIALLVGQPSRSQGSTLFDIAQITPSTQFVRWTDTGSTTSTLTTMVNGVYGVALDVNLTFQATNAYYAIGTTVAGKFLISGTISPYGYSTFGGTKSQYFDHLTFSFTDTTGSINFLSGTTTLPDSTASLDQLSSNTAYIAVDYGMTDLRLTSSAFNLNTASDTTQALQLNFSPLTPTTFADAANNHSLDTENMNITTGSKATAVAGPIAPVPEPGSAMLTLVGCALGLRRRR